ncbi:MAG: HypC/HybG/HupF family hydrogenase formation chaperone [bacterium]|nr:HypC/HybG/HupF family hydrogenase formation chaperone [bacterium]
MCLAVPMKLTAVNSGRGIVESGGVQIFIMLTMTPEARCGDYVLVHAGFALTVVDEREALKTLDLLKELVREGE